MEAIRAILDFLEAVFQNTEKRASLGVKNPPAKAEDGFSPWSGTIPSVSELPSPSTVVEPGRAQELQPPSSRAGEPVSAGREAEHRNPRLARLPSGYRWPVTAALDSRGQAAGSNSDNRGDDILATCPGLYGASETFHAYQA